MKTAILCLFLLTQFVGMASSSEIRIETDPPKTYVPEHFSRALGKMATVEEEMTATRIFRDGKLRVKIENIKQTVTWKGKEPETKDLRILTLFAKERAILRIENDDFRPSEVISPWPIAVLHRAYGNDGKRGHYNVMIPAVDFYEYLEYEEGKLKPMLEGENYTGMKEAHWELAVDCLSDAPPGRVR